MTQPISIKTRRRRVALTTRQIRKLNNAKRRLAQVTQEVLYDNPNAASLVLPKSDEVKPCNVLVEEYFNIISPTLRPKTILEKRAALKRFSDYVGPRVLSRDVVEQFVKDLYEIDWGDSTKHLTGVTVKTLLNWLQDTGRIGSDCVKGIPWPKKPAQVARANFTKEEIDLLLETAGDRPIGWVVRLGYHTGFALTDACGLCWKSVDMERGVIHKPRQKTGVDATVTFDFGTPMRAALERQREDAIKAFGVASGEYPVCRHFYTPGKPNGKLSASVMFRRLCEKAGVEYKSFHSLRATMLTELAHSDAPLAVSMSVAGLRDPKQFLSYVSAQPEKIREQIRRMRT